MTSAMRLARLPAGARTPACGQYLSALLLASTRPWVAEEIDRFPLSTYDTVLAETPACRTTSEILTMAEHAPSLSVIEALRLR